MSRALRFLASVALFWIVARAIVLWPTPPMRPAKPAVRWAPSLSPVAPMSDTPMPAGSQAEVRRVPGRSSADQETPSHVLKAETFVLPQIGKNASPGPSPAPAVSTAMTSPPQRRQGPAVSAWVLVRPSGGAPGLAPAGQLGASQAGVRATAPLLPRLAAAARLSGPLDTRDGREAALGLDWRPVDRLPVAIAVERRIGLSRGGRNAFALFAYGGVSDMPVAGRITIDGYAQLGLVGVRRRDGFVDGAVRIGHPIGGRAFAGAGLWGGAQPGAARLDIGPQIGVRLGPARVSLDWRQRVAGHARPGSGPALTLGADF
jgi:hypothetical protein